MLYSAHVHTYLQYNRGENNLCTYKFSSVWGLEGAGQASTRGTAAEHLTVTQWDQDLGDQTSHGDRRDQSEEPQDSEGLGEDHEQDKTCAYANAHRIGEKNKKLHNPNMYCEDKKKNVVGI